MFPLANALPENTGDGYVAGAYVVFFVLLLIYLAIMALRLSHTERDLRDLQARSSAKPPQPRGQAKPEQAPQEQTPQEGSPQEGAAEDPPRNPPHEEPHERTLEREPV